MRKFSVLLAVSGFLAFSSLASSESIISDSFESGDLYTTSPSGFRWSLNTKVTSVVTASTEVFITSPVNRPAPETSQWEAKTGDHSMMLRYNAGKSWTEQKFHWDEPQPEIWMSFWLRVPTNYAHPEKGGAGDNQKLFYLWMDAYAQNGDGTSVGMEFRGNGNGGSYFYSKLGGSGDRGSAPFINVPRDRGRWMHLVVHVDSESSPGAKDGLMEVWRKWEDETDYTQTQNLINQPIKLSSTKKGFASGYLMGWANAVYPVETEFLIDDFELATSPLFTSSNAPNAPSSIVVK